MGDQERLNHEGMTGIHHNGKKGQLRKVIISVDLPGTDSYEGTAAEERQELVDGDRTCHFVGNTPLLEKGEKHVHLLIIGFQIENLLFPEIVKRKMILSG